MTIEWVLMLIEVATVMALLVAAVFWLGTARRISQDPRLHPQAQQGMSYAVLLVPPLALIYWVTSREGQTPFWLQPLAEVETAPSAPEALER